MTQPASSPDPLLSVQSISLLINRHFTSVTRSIARQKIQPVAISGTHKFYHPDVAELVRKNLRKENQAA